MESKQLARLNAMKRGQAYCKEHNDELVAIEEYGDEKASFDDKVKSVEDAELKSGAGYAGDN